MSESTTQQPVELTTTLQDLQSRLDNAELRLHARAYDANQASSPASRERYLRAWEDAIAEISNLREQLEKLEHAVWLEDQERGMAANQICPEQI